jgi:tryptophanyl-tRNA synthetase
MRILSGIQPSGALHLGNYFGMMRPAIELQDKGDAYYFIANYHSMTSLFDAGERRKNTLDVALDFLACGLDPKKSVFFRQSDVPEVTELAWMLTTLTPMGLLERCTSYKDKIAKGLSANHGLFAYPVLMAADILIYDSNVVPVGRDQKQHVEVTRDIAMKFNEQYGRTFVIAPADVANDFEHRLRQGGLGYGDLKKALFEHYWNYFTVPRAKRAELAANLDYVHGVLADGAARATALAHNVLARAKVASGLD